MHADSDLLATTHDHREISRVLPDHLGVPNHNYDVVRRNLLHLSVNCYLIAVTLSESKTSEDERQENAPARPKLVTVFYALSKRVQKKL